MPRSSFGLTAGGFGLSDSLGPDAPPPAPSAFFEGACLGSRDSVRSKSERVSFEAAESLGGTIESKGATGGAGSLGGASVDVAGAPAVSAVAVEIVSGFERMRHPTMANTLTRSTIPALAT